MRLDDRARSDVGAVEKHGVRADSRAVADIDMVDLEHAVLEGVRLEERLHGHVVAEAEHVGIDHMRETGAEERAPPDAAAHRAQVCDEHERALEE